MRHSAVTPRFSDTQPGIQHFQYKDNNFNVSSLYEFYKPVTARGFAIKFVTQGEERYTVDKQVYNVDAGSYLLLSGDRDINVEIESKKNVNGICINIHNAIMEAALASYQTPDSPHPDQELAAFFYSDHFLENQYRVTNTHLGIRLQQLGRDVQASVFSVEDINDELFYTLAEEIIKDQVPVFRELQQIPVLKTATKKDLYRRILRGREYMDLSFAAQLSIELVARQAAMSEYHFFRLFKSVYGISPHQYILRKRLEAGMALLQKEYSVSSAAIECGFSDIYSFSKAFKKHFGVTPSSVIR